jgi:CBS-domain-containing membrane protein
MAPLPAALPPVMFKLETVYSAAPGKEVSHALTTMREHKIHRLPVLNLDGELEGILSLNDIVRMAKPAWPHSVPIRSNRRVCIRRTRYCLAQCETVGSNLHAVRRGHERPPENGETVEPGRFLSS